MGRAGGFPKLGNGGWRVLEEGECLVDCAAVSTRKESAGEKTLPRARALFRRGEKEQDRVGHMRAKSGITFIIAGLVAFSLASCGGGSGSLGRVGFKQAQTGVDAEEQVANQDDSKGRERLRAPGEDNSIWNLFKRKDTGTTVKVNRYLWNASLDVLNFLPIRSIDPFTGVIVMGYGTPPGGGRAYRATVYIKDPALDARSLNVALATRGGPVAEGTQRAVEDAILARARQLRIADKKY